LAIINNGVTVPDPDEFYTNINEFFESTNVNFMNHGYYPSHDFIKKEDIDFKNQLSLYLSLFDNLKIENKNILEIGCGRGGGIKGISKYFNFKEIHACDLNQENIKYCKTNNKTNINFKVSNAEKLTYEDNYFDIVINVESSYNYENYPLFFNEVKRVLKPNGIFLYADLGTTIHYFSTFFYLFKNIIRTDITENVANACKDDIENFKNLKIRENVKDWLVHLAESKYYKKYSLSNNQYIRYICSDSDDWFKK
jgi:ubiquinone/menaquinone biosynthesis C-methylase UbiE